MKTIELTNTVDVIRNKLLKPIAINSYAELDDKVWNKVPVATHFTFTTGNAFPDYDSKLHPFSSAGNVEIRRLGNNSTMQILYDSAARIFIRTIISGSDLKWSSWAKI